MDKNQHTAIKEAYERIHGNIPNERRETVSVREKPRFKINIYDKNSHITVDDIKEIIHIIGRHMKSNGYDDISLSVDYYE